MGQIRQLIIEVKRPYDSFGKEALYSILILFDCPWNKSGQIKCA
jgi:hypothetical protein